ncbi:YndM family protein [Paenibacillus spongiae]|uniref:YndM family protein n=1 Tax=Paenibacillus spongiae TaxID=2909671 RepID=A0ABY5SK27_9BACL|nr:YndM family protein [Paenibacillus spongiae]UVI32958.1 YndM family protein [Paenibacillus spongiae]
MFKYLVKWVLNSLILIFMLQFYTGIPIWTAFMASALLTAITYVIGDRLVLREYNNTAATLTDGLVTLLFLYMAEVWFAWGLSNGNILFISAVVAVGEAFLHRYIFQDELKGAYKP